MIGKDDFPQGAALVIGGSGGLGGAICAEFAKAGCPVALTYRSNRDKADAVVGEITAIGSQAEAFPVDVTDRAQVEALVQSAAARFSRLHTLVFVAGVMPTQKYISGWGEAEWETALNVEMRGFYNSVQAILPHFREAGGGSIVHLGSGGDLAWAPRDGLSIVPKAANEALVRGVAREEGRFGVRANSVLVGVIEAGMYLKFAQSGELGPDYAKKTLERLALKRLGKPEDVARPVVFLASNWASYVTGQQIAAAGGYGI